MFKDFSCVYHIKGRILVAFMSREQTRIPLLVPFNSVLENPSHCNKKRKGNYVNIGKWEQTSLFVRHMIYLEDQGQLTEKLSKPMKKVQNGI